MLPAQRIDISEIIPSELFCRTFILNVQRLRYKNVFQQILTSAIVHIRATRLRSNGKSSQLPIHCLYFNQPRITINPQKVNVSNNSEIGHRITPIALSQQRLRVRRKRATRIRPNRSFAMQGQHTPGTSRSRLRSVWHTQNRVGEKHLHDEHEGSE